MVYVYQLGNCTMGQEVQRRHLIPDTLSGHQANTRRNYDEKSVTETVYPPGFFVNLFYLREENLYLISLYKGIPLCTVLD
jgi:hypothetical protein